MLISNEKMNQRIRHMLLLIRNQKMDKRIRRAGVRGRRAAACGSPATLALGALALGAHLGLREFRFKYVEAKRDRDLKRIPDKFSDERLEAPSAERNLVQTAE